MREIQYVSLSFLLHTVNFLRNPQMLESKFQSELIKELKKRFKGCIVLKNDANYIQGIPDILILFEDKWAALECKVANKSSRRPNQEYYVNQMNKMSFCSFISVENKEEVLNDLERSFGIKR